MLNNIGLPGLLLIAVVVLVLFGRGKISSLMGEVGKGITAFKRGVSESSSEDKERDREHVQPREITDESRTTSGATGSTGSTAGSTSSTAGSTGTASAGPGRAAAGGISISSA